MYTKHMGTNMEQGKDRHAPLRVSYRFLTFYPLYYFYDQNFSSYNCQLSYHLRVIKILHILFVLSINTHLITLWFLLTVSYILTTHISMFSSPIYVLLNQFARWYCLYYFTSRETMFFLKPRDCCGVYQQKMK